MESGREDSTRRENDGGVVPPAVVGSPVDLPPGPPGDTHRSVTNVLGEIPWWRPNAGDVARVLGWRWVLMGPAMVVGLGLPLLALFGHSPLLKLLAPLSVKLLITAWGVILSLATWGVQKVVRARRDPFCIHCGYSLTGLGESGTCPECGRGYTRALMEEYRKDPDFFAHRHKVVRKHPEATPFAAGEGRTADDGTG